MSTICAGTKPNEMERCRVIWWVKNSRIKANCHLNLLFSFATPTFDILHRAACDLVITRWKKSQLLLFLRNCEKIWDLSVISKHIWECPLNSTWRVESLPLVLKTSCARINHLFLWLRRFSHVFILPLLKCWLVQQLPLVSGLNRATFVQKLFNGWLHKSV